MAEGGGIGLDQIRPLVGRPIEWAGREGPAMAMAAPTTSWLLGALQSATELGLTLVRLPIGRRKINGLQVGPVRPPVAPGLEEEEEDEASHWRAAFLLVLPAAAAGANAQQLVLPVVSVFSSVEHQFYKAKQMRLMTFRSPHTPRELQPARRHWQPAGSLPTGGRRI